MNKAEELYADLYINCRAPAIVLVPFRAAIAGRKTLTDVMNEACVAEIRKAAKREGVSYDQFVERAMQPWRDEQEAKRKAS